MIRSRRYLLLPLWIRCFSWIFLVIGGFGTVFGALGLIFDFQSTIFVFGLQYAGPLRGEWPVTLTLIWAFLGYTAYLLLWGKKEGRKAGLAAGYLGLVISVLVIVVRINSGVHNYPFDPLLQIPFIIVLHRLKGRWEDEPDLPPDPAPASGTVPPAGQQSSQP
jgi:hypothetical protein